MQFPWLQQQLLFLGLLLHSCASIICHSRAAALRGGSCDVVQSYHSSRLEALHCQRQLAPLLGLWCYHSSHLEALHCQRQLAPLLGLW